jgi:D-psicose/D-tagatose/L-ribulose 3-epimerase
VKSAKNLLFHVHISENDRGVPGSGHVDWDGLLTALGEVGYKRWLVIESFVPGIREISKAASIWRNVAPDGDTIAREGLKYLRKYFPKQPELATKNISP